ncbi:glycosyltransferase family 2 protein [Bacteroides cellulosilyticus]|jgi:glycosyltransferase involved in cell wall biosynthesis|uniref:Glycosyltransferase family 2 protein n=2 Tax=Bacteroides cellulosilyticus TaxID=246787 RepID=A0A412I001_9BACE|nr:glycosyltransferase family 2 protein [Bacteroides cellulosilyticus]RGS30187.1 glycosyltransferase family 2 protein [Bacteroides cellulosilyticus]
MNYTPLVTAIITTHNRNDLVGRAIESVLHQTYKNLECIVVDDASIVSAEAVCRKYSVEFIYIPKAESKGGNHARNVGIKAAKGEYIAFLDDDDYWLPTKIEKQVALIIEKQCALVYSNAKAEIVQGNNVTYMEYSLDYTKRGDMHEKIFMSICCLNITILVEKQKLFEVGLFDEDVRFWQEYELTMRLAQVSLFYFVDEILAVYRVNVKDTGRLTNKYYEWRKAVDYIYDKHKKYYSQLSVFGKYYARMTFVQDAIERMRNAGLVFKRCIYLFLLNTAFIPLRLILKFKRNMAYQQYLLFRE